MMAMFGRGSRVLVLGVVLAAAVLFALNCCVLAQEAVDINAFSQEIQKNSTRTGEMTTLLWFPDEYWQLALSQSPNASTAQAEEFMKVLRPYTVVAVIDGAVGTYGTVTYKSEADIRSRIQLVDNQGNTYAPYADDAVSAEAKGLLAIMKMGITNSMGPKGQNMYFFFFPAQGKAGQNIAQARQEGFFSVKLGDRDFRWDLPLNSVLPSKVCPVCKKKLSGSYKFCPLDGAKLE